MGGAARAYAAAVPTMRPPLDARLLGAGALAVFATAVPTALVVEPAGGLTTVDGHTGARIALLAVATLPVIAVRQAPALVLGVLAAASVASAALGWSTGTAALALVVALAATAYTYGRRAALVCGVLGVAVILAAYALLAGPGQDVSGEAVAFNVTTVVLALVTGVVLRGHRLALDALAERNRRLEELRDVEKREAVATDRVRIARELHDIVGHALAAITLQARAGQRQVRRDVDAASATFGHIETVASRALEETREVVGVLRSGRRRGLGDLPRLVEAVATPDVRVELEVSAGGDVPDAAQAAAYRIVQESLANVVKHAGSARATVRVAREDGALRVRVQDDGAGGAGSAAGPAPGGGLGLDGMRTRVERLGGELSAGPADGGGWRVDARLPLEAAP